MKSILLFSGLALFALNAQQYTRGVGVYPGDPKADFAPTLVEDSQTYRNLALHRPAYQSSTYDFNLAAQLVTDGIKDTKLPRWISIATSDRGTLSRQELCRARHGLGPALRLTDHRELGAVAEH